MADTPEFTLAEIQEAKEAIAEAKQENKPEPTPELVAQLQSMEGRLAEIENWLRALRGENGITVTGSIIAGDGTGGSGSGGTFDQTLRFKVPNIDSTGSVSGLHLVEVPGRVISTETDSD